MILITGGTGMVGMHLLLALTKEETMVRAIYRTEDKVTKVEDFFAFAKAESQFSRIHWFEADITDIPSLNEAFKGITRVYHCAALISFDPYDYHKLKKVNTEGTANVVNLCLFHNVVKLCYLSSIATLAKTPNKPITEENYWNPDAENSVYAITKYGAEMEVWRGTQEGLPAVILNPGVILGEGNYNSGSGAIFKRLYDGLNYYSAGSTGVIDVKDLVEAMLEAMDKPMMCERFILISQNISYKELVSSVSLSLGLKSKTKRVSLFALQLFRCYDLIKGWFVRRRQLTRVDVHALQETSVYDNSKALTNLSLNLTPLKKSLERISQHFLHFKSTKEL
ncbi:NAD-dependent epimerase/dehydratase family protein [Dokdonia sinensis]|uniref:NAD-dependent epimerase/dehydratase family protein n=2 Tax=Dokdonia sinensis TaxID=2479847 RepID=A0A3M0G303_9FLAO|nr:NAD-dependent epimerase/dehydratase family protein [Dokdonia sinensis]